VTAWGIEMVSTRHIEIVDYDPTWPLGFDHHERRIRAALPGRVLSIEHVGSTSVPGLAAKPVIDIHVSVKDSAADAIYAPALEAAGYRLVLREPDWFEHRMFRGIEPEANVHIFSAGCPELQRCKLFRDWLRLSSEDRGRYSEAKRLLAIQSWDSVDQYAEAKTLIVEEILGNALRARGVGRV
jgi:GrpB-like predicted nucleotidyltransferase (UPF0157 family)